MESLSSSETKKSDVISSTSDVSHLLTFKNISVLELLLRWSERESSYQFSPDDTSLHLPLVLADLVEDVPVDQLLLAGPLLQLHGERLLPCKLGCKAILNVSSQKKKIAGAVLLQ